MADYLTEQLPGIGGEIKQVAEDFVVEELPLYLPSGEGEHLYLLVEKVGLTTLELVRLLAEQLPVKEREIGYAGLKDARAVTRQYLSLTGVTAQQALALKIPGIKVLASEQHGNKLRLGHLAGNRFRIRVRNVQPQALAQALDILHVLQDLGVPNRFGEQRYGVLGNSHLIGAALLRRQHREAIELIIGDPEQIDNARWREAADCFRNGKLQAALEAFPGRFHDERRLLQQLLTGASAQQALQSLPRSRTRLYLSAYQSSLFDRILQMRLNSLETLWPGDLAFKHANGACFSVDRPEQEQARAYAFEISPTAPLYGHKVKLASAQAGLLEQSLLDKEQLKLSDFKLPNGLAMAGERRPLRVPLQQVSAVAEGRDLLLGFVLPRGAFATSVLHEVMKTAPG